jgi:hypothetical protein
MDAKERSRLKDLNTLRIANLAIPIKAAVAAKQVMRQALSRLSSREVDDMYTAEYRDGEITKAKQAFRDKMVELYNKEVESSITNLGASLEEQHSELDLENPALQNALKMIEQGGQDLSGNTMRQLVKPFAHDQPTLEALQPIIKHAGILYDGGSIKCAMKFRRLSASYRILLETHSCQRVVLIVLRQPLEKWQVSKGSHLRRPRTRTAWVKPCIKALACPQRDLKDLRGNNPKGRERTRKTDKSRLYVSFCDLLIPFNDNY